MAKASSVWIASLSTRAPACPVSEGGFDNPPVRAGEAAEWTEMEDELTRQEYFG